jgi:hypothetical protein
MSGSAPSAAWLWTGRIALGLSLTVSAGYFLSLAVIAIPALGGRDMGLALVLAFVSAAAAYGSFALAAADALLLALAVGTGRPSAQPAAALLAALLPGIVLVGQHLAGR